ncbi:MAG: response regulator [Giesbergeria sp.]|jgi:response regulator NasT|nr:response regulator [Giesbergeria sp.]
MPDAPVPRPVHLLLVDDDRLIQATLSSGLRDAGYQVSTAESVDDAEALLTSGLRPDMALVDVRMPGRNGLELAERLRDLDHIPFLMLSAYSDAQTVERASDFGALGYLVKPLDVAQIRPAVEAGLRRARELDALRQTREQLQKALDGDRDINVATGITMVQYRLPRAAAFELLRASSRSQRRKLAELAREVIEVCNGLHAGPKT